MFLVGGFIQDVFNGDFLSLYRNSVTDRSSVPTLRERLTSEMRLAAVSAQISCIYRMSVESQVASYEEQGVKFDYDAKLEINLDKVVSRYYALPEEVLYSLLTKNGSSLKEAFSSISSINVKPFKVNQMQVVVKHDNNMLMTYDFTF